MSEEPKRSAGIVRMLVDYGGLIVFVGTYLVSRSMITATWGLVAGSAAALAVGLVFQRRLAPLPLFAGLAALIFGGLTLIFHDPRFVKIKPTAINVVLGAAMLIGAAMGKNPLKGLFGEALTLSEAGWRKLTVRYGVFFLAMAVLNEAVWRTQPDAVWVIFRFPGLQLLSVAFALTQVPMMMKDMKAAEAAAELEL